MRGPAAAPLTPQELAATPLILRERGSGTRQVLDSALAVHGGLAQPLLELSSTTAVKGAAESGAGPCVLSELALGEELSSRRLVKIPVAGCGCGVSCGRSGPRDTGRRARPATCCH